MIDGALDRSLVFLEECFAEGQEMLVFLSDLSRSPDAGRYLKEHSCPRFEAHKDLMMVEEQEEKLRRQLEKLSFRIRCEIDERVTRKRREYGSREIVL